MPRHHVSSAIVTSRQEHTEGLAALLAGMEGVEVHAQGPGKIVVVIEGPGSGFLGETLIRISAIDEVIAAHMVFEQAMEATDDDRTHAA